MCIYSVLALGDAIFYYTFLIVLKFDCCLNSYTCMLILYYLSNAKKFPSYRYIAFMQLDELIVIIHVACMHVCKLHIILIIAVYM